MDHLHHNSYKFSFELSNIIWEIVRRWDAFARRSIGGQLVRAVDSISSNIAEGWGRYHKKDKLIFYNYARASLNESIDWVAKASTRGLISGEEYSKIDQLLKKLPKELNGLIKETKENLRF